jgi:hypothetical protein
MEVDAGEEGGEGGEGGQGAAPTSMMTVQACRPVEKVRSPITATQVISSIAVAVMQLFEIRNRCDSSASHPVSSHGSNVGADPQPISPSSGIGSGLPPGRRGTLKMSSS